MREHDDGEGLVNADTFFDLMNQSDIKPKAHEIEACKKDHGRSNGSKIRYERAVRCWYYLRDTHEWMFSPSTNKLSPSKRNTRGLGWATLQNETHPEPMR